MKDIIAKYKSQIVQINTPYGSGTGFILGDKGVVVTNRHVIHGANEVAVKGDSFPKQMLEVIYTDSLNDIAFLRLNEPVSVTEIRLSERGVEAGERIIAIGHPLGLEFTATQGIVSKEARNFNNVDYIQVDAAINPGNSGGPLINEAGEIVGVNTFIFRDGESLGFALPSGRLIEIISEYESRHPARSAKCTSCTKVILKEEAVDGYCPNCGNKFLDDEFIFKDFVPGKIQSTVENILSGLGKDVKLARVGQFGWDIEEGSSLTKIDYNNKDRFIYADAVLGTLPKENLQGFYQYLLQENFHLDQINFSINGQNVMLSTIIFDEDLREASGKEILGELFTLADKYDNYLADHYGMEMRIN
ncbi:MAG: DUF1610 domain-containing protein [Crocinitomicaceae bacterium]|nr:DUF1610 domain-containing protein [Crocinitomicaceae bacterium]